MNIEIGAFDCTIRYFMQIPEQMALTSVVVVVVASIPGSSLQSQHLPANQPPPGDDDLMPMDLNAPLEDDAVALLRGTDIFLAGVRGWLFLCFFLANACGGILMWMAWEKQWSCFLLILEGVFSLISDADWVINDIVYSYVST